MYSFVAYSKSLLNLKFHQLGRKLNLYFRALTMNELRMEKRKFKYYGPRWMRGGY